MIDQRAIILAKKIINHRIISLEQLSNISDLSYRQIIYSIEKINEWLETTDIPKIFFDPIEKMISVDEKTSKSLLFEISNLPVENYIFSQEERISSIYLILFLEQQYISMSHFVSFLKVSKSTITGDMSLLEENLTKYQITIDYNRDKGFLLVGDELDIRYYFFKEILQIISEENQKIIHYLIDDFQLHSFNDIKGYVYSLLNEYDISFVENRLIDISYSLPFLIYRIQHLQKKLTFNNAMHRIEKLKEYRFSENLLNHYKITDVGNITYLTAWILGNSTGETNYLSIENDVIFEFSENIFRRFESLSGVKLENKSTLARELYHHLRPSFYRLYYQLPVVNPFEEKIKQRFPDIYRILYHALESIFPENSSSIIRQEASFLTIYFEPLINEDIKLTHITSNKMPVGLVVCSNGIGTSAIVLRELEKLLPHIRFLPPVEYSEIDNVKEHYDIIFSTVMKTSLLTKDKQCLIVSPIMDNHEKIKILRQTNHLFSQGEQTLFNIEELLSIIEKHCLIEDKQKLTNELLTYFYQDKSQDCIGGGDGPMLSEIIHEDLIQLRVKATSWEDAIVKASLPLVEHNIITDEYVEAMIQTTKETGPYIVITKHVALPHARPEHGANELGISISTLKDPIEFGNKDNDPVKYIFCLSAVDTNSHLRAISELVELLEDEQFYHLLNTGTPESIYQYVKDHEEKKGE